jgi:hypothetical protein
MIRRILILGASYGSLFSTKLLMAVHDVTLVCRRATAELINTRGTEVDLPFRGETAPRRIRSIDLSGRLDAKTRRWSIRRITTSSYWRCRSLTTCIIGRQNGIRHPTIDHTVALIDAALARIKVSAA